jgi:hypothetical protein
MKIVKALVVAFGLLFGASVALGQQSTSQSPTGNADVVSRNTVSVRGCLQGSRGNYLVVENNTGMIYVLKGVGNKLDSQLRHEVEVQGRMLHGTIKTGISPEKSGSNPTDTVHGVDGVPLQVADVQADVRTTAKRCKAADQE